LRHLGLCALCAHGWLCVAQAAITAAVQAGV